MDLAHKLLALTTALLLTLGAFFATQWLRAHDAYVQAQAQIKAGQSTLAQLAKQQSDLAAQLKQTQSQQQSQLDALHKEYAQAQSPQQLASLISSVMNLPQPIKITTPAPAPDNPNPQPVAVVPLPDAPQAKAFIQGCQECQIELATAQKQAAITTQQTNALKQQLALTEKERDTWKHTAQGGSWTRRAAKRVEAFAIDAAITAVAACASHHCR
ncbi:MAG TPA: hypothetical protein VGF20_09295 [Candidatus Acidoferrum sp.]|jgi:hypothetical protein